MLIHLDASAVASAIGGGADAARSLACVENILLAHHDGCHIASLALEDLLKLGARKMSERAKGALLRLRVELPEIEGLRSNLNTHLRLGLGPSFDNRVHPEGARSVIRADLHHFELIERTARSILLGENLTDTRLYTLLARALLASKDWRTTSVAFDERGGGGNTIAESFARSARDGRILLAIADSDRRWPTAALGGTAKALQGASRAVQGDFQRAIVLHVRSAEALISFAVYEEALTPHLATPSVPERLSLLERAAPQPWRDHAELKEGLKLAQVTAMREDHPEAAFWIAVSRAAGRDACTQPRPCQRKEDCKCYVVEALGGRALERAVTWLEEQKPKRLARLLEIHDRPELEDLCAQVAAWGITAVKRRT